MQAALQAQRRTPAALAITRTLAAHQQQAGPHGCGRAANRCAGGHANQRHAPKRRANCHASAQAKQAAQEGKAKAAAQAATQAGSATQAKGREAAQAGAVEKVQRPPHAGCWPEAGLRPGRARGCGQIATFLFLRE